MTTPKPAHRLPRVSDTPTLAKERKARPLNNRLGELLDQNEFLFGVICRDVTLTDVEVMAQEGYNIVWFDLEHGPQATEDVIRMGRTVAHLGMVPLARVPELSRTHVQRLLDGGMQIITVPDVRSADEAAELVRLGKFPPRGERGVSTTSGGTNFTLGDDPQKTLREANDATHLMVMVETDEGYEALDDILAVDGVDIVTAGTMDWSVSLGLYGAEGQRELAPKAERVLTAARDAGKLTSSSVSSGEQATRFAELGVRIFFTGVDITLKRGAFARAIGGPREALGGG